MGPYARVDYCITSPYVHSKFGSNTFTMGGNPIPESTLTLSQSRIYRAVRDYEFGLWLQPPDIHYQSTNTAIMTTSAIVFLLHVRQIFSLPIRALHM
jgi:hypothetical protein